MTPEVWDPKNCRKIAKMWNHYELVEQVGGHQYPPGSILPLRNQWSPLCQVPPSDGETSVESDS
jgi:hypothetical protein